MEQESGTLADALAKGFEIKVAVKKGEYGWCP
jgi:hypothetical protein